MGHWFTASMLGAILQAIKGIITLRKSAREDKKTGLEIKQLERQLKDDEKLVRPATFDEVKEYDPKVRGIQAQFQPPKFQPPKETPPPAHDHLFYVLLVLAALLLAALFMALMRFF